MSLNTAYFNGQYLPLDQAQVSVLDRGFLFGDAVYEVIPVYAGRCYQLAAHIERLQNSLAGIRLKVDKTAEQWQDIINELVAKNQGDDCSVYLQVSRGAEAQRAHALPENPKPTIVAWCQASKAVDPAVFENGIKAITLPDPRWQFNHIKSTALLANILAGDDVRTAGAQEALLIRNGNVMEGSSSNVFAVLDGVITTPTLRDEILAGITRASILRLAAENNLKYEETRALTLTDIHGADEIWISSSTREIYPVTQLDNHIVGTGKPGPVWQQLFKLLQADATQNG